MNLVLTRKASVEYEDIFDDDVTKQIPAAKLIHEVWKIKNNLLIIFLVLILASALNCNIRLIMFTILFLGQSLMAQ